MSVILDDHEVGTDAQKRSTLQQVAREAQVSMSTASRVLNGSAKAVSPSLSEHVRLVARKLGYVASGYPRAATGSPDFGIVAIRLEVAAVAAEVVALTHTFRARDADVIIGIASDHTEVEAQVRRLLTLRAHAVVILQAHPQDGAPAIAEIVQRSEGNRPFTRRLWQQSLEDIAGRLVEQR